MVEQVNQTIATELCKDCATSPCPVHRSSRDRCVDGWNANCAYQTNRDYKKTVITVSEKAEMSAVEVNIRRGAKLTINGIDSLTIHNPSGFTVINQPTPITINNFTNEDKTLTITIN